MSFLHVFVRHPVLTMMVNLALAITGLLSYTHLNVDLLPDVDKPLITITTTLDGASPSQVESQIPRRVEDAAALVSASAELPRRCPCVSRLQKGGRQQLI